MTNCTSSPGVIAAGAHVAGADPEHGDDRGEDEEDHDGGQQRARADAAERGGVGALGQRAEDRAARRLVGVGLHRLRGEQALGGLGARCGDPVLVLARQRRAAGGRASRIGDDDERHPDEDERGELRAGPEEEREAADERQHVAQRHRDRGADHREDEGGVGGQPRQHLAGHDPLVEARAHADHPVVDRAADVGDHPLAEAGDEVEARRGAEREERRDAEGGEEVGVDERERLGEEVVDHPPHRQRQAEREAGGDRQRRERPPEQRAVGADEGPEPAQGPDRPRLRALRRARLLRHRAFPDSAAPD